MKKSFLKRAMAAAIAVPVALTQTMMFASVSADEAAAGDITKITIDTFMNTNIEEMVSDAADTTRVYKQSSDWNVKMYNAVNAMAGEAYVLDRDALAQAVTGDAWYVDLLKNMISTGGMATAAINSDDVVVTVDVNYVYGPDASEILSDKLGLDLNVTGGPLTGTLVLTVKTDKLGVDKTVPVELKLIETDDDIMTIYDIPEYIQKNMNKLRAKAEEAAAADEAALQQVKDLFDSYQAKLDTLKAKVAEAMTSTKDASYQGENVDAILAAVKADYADNKYVDKIPNTVEEALDNATVASIVGNVVDQVNGFAAAKGYSIEISKADIAAVANSLTNVSVAATVANGVANATATGEVADAVDVDALYTYFADLEEEQGYTIVDGTFETAMYVEAEANGNAATFTGDVYFDVVREITYQVEEVKPTEPTPTEPTPTEPPTEPEKVLTVIGDDVNFFFSHDESPLEPEALLEKAELSDLVDGEMVNAVDVMDKISFGVDDNGPDAALTPAKVYEADGNAYAAMDLFIYYTADGEEPVLVEGSTVTIYVGVKGDARLDGDANARDAAAVLVYAAAVGSGKEDTALYSEEDETLERLAFFLADIDTELTEVAPLELNSRDAAKILVFAAKIGSGDTRPIAVIWNEIMNPAANEVA